MSLPHLRLHQLRALVAVVETGGIRAGARALSLSQAALTKALRELEDDAGLPLLVRSPRGVSLTDAGERLLARARLVTRQIELAGEELRTAAGDPRGQVRLALTPAVTLNQLGPAFRWFRQRYPLVSVEVAEGLVSRVLPRLRDGSLDLAVVADTGDLPIGEFEQTTVLTVRQCIVVRAGHPVLAAPTPDALGRLEWVLSGPRDGLKSSRLRAVFARAGVQPPERILACDTLAGLTLLRESDVAGVVPEPVLATPEGRGLAVVDEPALDPGALRLELLTRPDVPLSPPAACFVHCLLQVCAGTPEGGLAASPPQT